VISLQRKDSKEDQTQIIISCIYNTNTNMVRTSAADEEVFRGTGFSVLA
jgi:hypothetical protein